MELWPPTGEAEPGLGSSGHDPQPGLGKQQLCLEHCTWRFYLTLKRNRRKAGEWAVLDGKHSQLPIQPGSRPGCETPQCQGDWDQPV